MPHSHLFPSSTSLGLSKKARLSNPSTAPSQNSDPLAHHIPRIKPQWALKMKEFVLEHGELLGLSAELAGLAFVSRGRVIIPGGGGSSAVVGCWWGVLDVITLES